MPEASPNGTILKLAPVAFFNLRISWWSSLPNPAPEPGDVLRVTYPDGSKELHQVASFSVPLEVGGGFTIQTISAKEGS